MAYKITDKCIECGTCESECPQKAIIPGSPYKIDPSKCVDCGGCEQACPNGAIVPGAS